MFICPCFGKKPIKRLLSLPKKYRSIELEIFVNDPNKRTILSETVNTVQNNVLDFNSDKIAKTAYVPQVGNIDSPRQSS